MRKLIFIIAFLITSFAFAQGGPKVDVIKFRGEVTTTVRNTFNVPTGETWFIYNVTTGLLEYANDNDVWDEVNVSQAVKMKFVTTAQRNALSVDGDEGWIVYNIDTQSIEWADGNNIWYSIESGSSLSDADQDIPNNVTRDINLGTGTSNVLFSDGSGLTGGRVMEITKGEINIGVPLLPNPLTNIGSNTEKFNTIYGKTGDYENIRLAPTDTEPFSSEGYFYADNSENRLKYYDGISWKAILLDGDVIGTDDQTATEVPFTPNGSIASTNVQLAIQELRDEAAAGTDNSLSEIDQNIDIGNGVPRTIDLLNGSQLIVKVDGINRLVMDANNSLFTGGMLPSTSAAPTLAAHLTNKNYVDGLDHTDDQTLSFVNGTLSIEDGNSVDINDESLQAPLVVSNYTRQSSLLRGHLQGIDAEFGTVKSSITDDQTLSLSGTDNTDLTIDGGNTVSLNETIQDAVGSMVIGNTETGITVNYDDVGGKLDFEVTGGGSDSGQGVSYVTLNTATTTLTNSNITASGTTNAKRVINLVTVNDTITIPTGLTKNQPFHIELEGADSTYIKPAVGVNFRIVDSVSTISGDGLILKGGSKGITAVIRSDETVKFYGELGVHIEAVASGQFDNAVDPVNEVNGVANITTENGTATSSVDFAQNGTYSAKFVADGVGTGRMFHQTTGITNGDSVTFSMWLYRDSTTDPSSNIFVGALNSDGWTTSSLLTVSNATVNSWVQVTGTVTANINNPTFRSYATSISANNVWYIDNLTYTIN